MKHVGSKMICHGINRDFTYIKDCVLRYMVLFLWLPIETLIHEQQEAYYDVEKQRGSISCGEMLPLLVLLFNLRLLCSFSPGGRV